MGKKRKEDAEGQETYEVWVYKTDGSWTQMVDKGNDGIFETKQRALAVSGWKSSHEGVVEAIVVERRLIASFNGPAIALKGRLKSGLRIVEDKKKEEKSDGDFVHGSRPQEGQVVAPGPGHEGKAGVPGPAGEADSAHRGG